MMPLTPHSGKDNNMGQKKKKSATGIDGGKGKRNILYVD